MITFIPIGNGDRSGYVASTSRFMSRLREMEMFVRVVDAGSFSLAARDMKIGQPAISKTIAGLEERLGVRLLVRSTRRLTPTEAGVAFYERALRAVTEADEADAAARGASASLEGRLRISAAVTFSRIHLVPRLAEFLDAHPRLELNSSWMTAPAISSPRTSMPLCASAL